MEAALTDDAVGGGSAIESLKTLYNNPFIFGPIFRAFFSQVPASKNNVLLSYLVLPLVLHPRTSSFFANAKSTSTIHTFLRERDRLAGLPQRVIDYRRITNLSLQYAYDSGDITILGSMAVTAGESIPQVASSPPGALKAAGKLGMIIGPFDVPTTYRMLGIKGL